MLRTKRAHAFVLLGIGLLLTLGSTRSAEPSLDEAWRQPPPEARLRAYWWWLNGNVDRAAITRDLEEMKAKGFGGAIICDAGGAEQRNNRRVPAGPMFGSPAWRELLRHTLREADRLGLEMSLNLQSGWNLGGPMVTADDAVKKLVTTELVVDGGGRVDVVLPQPQLIENYFRPLFTLAFPLRAGREPSGGVADWKQKTLVAKLAFTGPDAFFRTNSAPKTDVLVRSDPDRPGEEDTQPADVIDISAHVDAEGRLRWDAPAGRWQVIRFGCTLGDVNKVSTHSDTWAGFAIDVFDRGPFDRYANAVLVPLLEEMRGHRSLRFVTTDSWEVGLLNWTPNFREEFRQRRGYDLLPFMPAFTGHIVGSRAMTNRFLHDFRKTLGDLAIDNHYVPMRELARRFGLGTHPESGGPHYTAIDAQRCLGMNDVPMSEFWAQSPTHRTTEESRFFVKQPASAAHTYGRRFVAAEGFTTIGPHWQETLWDNLKPSFDYALGEGLNRLVWHAFVCSPESAGIPGQQYFAGTHLNPNATWWSMSEPFFAYINRCQAMLQRGLFVADALYYYGDHVPNYTQLRASDPAKLGAGYDYDVITEEALLERTAVKDGHIVLPDGMSYRVLVLPPEEAISLPVLRKIHALVAAGATVIGEKPARASSLVGQPAADEDVRRLADELWSARPANTATKGRVIAGRTAREVLQADGVPPAVAFASAPGARFVSMHRRDGETEIFFVANREKDSVNVAATFRVAGRAPELWDPVTGEQRFASAYTIGNTVTTVPLELPPFGSMFVVFRAPAAGREPSSASNAPRFDVARTLEGEWAVSFDPKWGGPATATFAALESWTARSEPGIRFYSGRATYRKTFTLTPDARRENLWLDLGSVRELAAVRINGRPAGVMWAPPFRVDISALVQPGENRLEVDVVNFWPNRIIGDASLPAEQRLTETNIAQLRANTPLMPSGLFGPVQLAHATAPTRR